MASYRFASGLTRGHFSEVLLVSRRQTGPISASSPATKRLHVRTTKPRLQEPQHVHRPRRGCHASFLLSLLLFVLAEARLANATSMQGHGLSAGGDCHCHSLCPFEIERLDSRKFTTWTTTVEQGYPQKPMMVLVSVFGAPQTAETPPSLLIIRQVKPLWCFLTRETIE